MSEYPADIPLSSSFDEFERETLDSIDSFVLMASGGGTEEDTPIVSSMMENEQHDESMSLSFASLQTLNAQRNRLARHE